MELTKHIVSGGYWLHKDGTWCNAGNGVLETLSLNAIIQSHLGWTSQPVVDVGKIFFGVLEFLVNELMISLAGLVTKKPAKRTKSQTW
jgi:hypothetical protein